MGSNESHFNVWVIVRNKVIRQCPQTTTFQEKGEPKQIRTEVSLLMNLMPLPLGQIGGGGVEGLAHQNRNTFRTSHSHHMSAEQGCQETGQQSTLGMLGKGLEVLESIPFRVQSSRSCWYSSYRSSRSLGQCTACSVTERYQPIQIWTLFHNFTCHASLPPGDHALNTLGRMLQECSTEKEMH